MVETEALNFNLTISSSYSTDDKLDRLTPQLLMKLKELDVESVSLVKSDSDCGNNCCGRPIGHAS